MARAYMTDAGEASAERDDAAASSTWFRRELGRWSGRGKWRRGWILAVFALILGLVMALHARVPNAIGNLGSLLETFLPWAGLGVLPLLLFALLRRSTTALIALLLPVLIWSNLFAGLLTDKTGGPGDLTVLTHNVDAENPDPAGTARDLVGAGVDVVALEELPSGSADVYDDELKGAFPHHVVEGTVGVWSKYPLSESRPVDIKIGWTRALRTSVTTPDGEVAVYVAHLPSVRVNFKGGFSANQRDAAAELLGGAIRREPLERIVLLGDLNGTMNDRALAPVTAQMRSTQGAAGAGFGFSWPASFPMARIDQIMVKGVEPVSSWTLPATGSDHLPVAASIGL